MPQQAGMLRVGADRADSDDLSGPRCLNSESESPDSGPAGPGHSAELPKGLDQAMLSKTPMQTQAAAPCWPLEALRIGHVTVLYS